STLFRSGSKSNLDHVPILRGFQHIDERAKVSVHGHLSYLLDRRARPLRNERPLGQSGHDCDLRTQLLFAATAG
ncbi:hypothetical protein, partial [Sinorhizobium fredii]|uniref:hypothetical protein n=1 Tax=Rhizobium fredii TaxID=380 RepID=UPI001AEBE566